MDSTHSMFCNNDLVTPLSSMGMQVPCILVVSHVFNVVFRTVGQPGPIGQVQAGLVLGPMSHIEYIQATFFPACSINYYEVLSSMWWCNMGGVFGLSVSFYLHQELNTIDSAPLYYFCMIIMLVMSYTSSPMVIRLAAELRFAASDVGRIAVSSALITEMGCLLFFNVMVVSRLVKRKKSKPEVLLSKTARTLWHKLGYSIYDFVLPVYFGYLGLQINLINVFKSLERSTNLAILILLSIGSKLGGTLIVCRYLKIPTSEGIFLGFILNTRGYADLLFIGAAAKQVITFDSEAYNVLLQLSHNKWRTSYEFWLVYLHGGNKDSSPTKNVSSFPCLYEDVCNEAEDLQVSIILLPFHKHQRIDGKLESGKEGIRITNQKVLRHAPCSVGIIVERRLARVPGFSELVASESIQNVATLFFGGPDDREAIAWSLRISGSPRVNLTIIRFLLSSSSQNKQIESGESEDKEILMSLSREETVNEIGNTFMVDFYNTYVTSGQIGHVEKFVKDGAQTLESLKEIGGIYSLFVVGKGGRGQSSLTVGMSDWEECPELGTVDDVLASSDFDIHGSVLIVQQHRDAKKALLHD
ncbi:Cation/H(+) antiporter 1 [Glycine soja]|nr:Cation/H(+) antiporter 1 [Glycine soja]